MNHTAVNQKDVNQKDVGKKKIENIVGALSLALSDDLLQAAQNHAPTSAPAAAISLVGHMPGMTINHLRSALGLSHPGTVRLVDRLVRDDLVKRDRSTTDGRAVALTLTVSGEAMCQHILASRQNTLARALASLSHDERETLGKLAETMLQNILRDEAHAIQTCRLCDPVVCTNCPVEAEIVSREGSEPLG
ncbi:MAG: MarR family winged helix-turn-helix transcriptional regulator [Phormidesmis sp.]